MSVVVPDHGARLVLDVFRRPGAAKAQRHLPLPAFMNSILAFPSSDDVALAATAAPLDSSAKELRTAAEFYIEQTLFLPDADCYRLLGGTADSSLEELRRNMVLLLRWLHPDHNALPHRTIFASKVANAWNTVKQPERRAAYDESIRAQRKSLARTVASRRAHRRRFGRASSGGVLRWVMRNILRRET